MVRSARLVFVGLLLFGALSGCLPVAWVLPPTQFDFGAGAAVETSANDQGATIVSPFSASVHPLGLMKEHHRRSFDAALGYRGLILYDRGQLLHAPFIEGTYLAMPVQVGFWQNLRLGVGGRGYVFFGHESTAFMPTLGLRGTVEFASHLDYEAVDCEVNNSGSFCGYSRHYGERGMGLYVEGQSSLRPEVGYRALYIGLVWRAPASAGAGFMSAW